MNENYHKRLAFICTFSIMTTYGIFPSLADDLLKINVMTNYVFNGRHAPFFVGKEKGFYSEAGFDVSVLPATGSGFVVTAVDAGQADYGMADVGSVVQAIVRGAKIKAFMTYTDVTTSGVASLAPYPTPESIVGKTFASSQSDVSRTVLPIIFHEHNLNISDLKWQSADPGVYASLLLSGQVDLITATSDSDMPGLRKLAASRGQRAYFTSYRDWGYDALGFVLIARQKNITENPAVVARFAEATKKSVEYAIAHEEEAADIVVKLNPLMNRENVLTQWHAAVRSMQTQYVAQNGYGNVTNERVRRSIILARKALGIEVDLSPHDVFTKVVDN